MNDDIRDQAAVSLIRTLVYFLMGFLEALRDSVQRLIDLLPPSEAESDTELNLEDTDEQAELRAVLMCVLKDHLEPATQSLRSVAREGGQTR